MNDTKTQLEARLQELQVWFASKPYGWRERATASQLQQWADRSREQDAICDRLAMIG